MRLAFGTWATKVRRAIPGRALELLPAAELPADLGWAAPHPRIAQAISRWAATVARETTAVIPQAVRARVSAVLGNWHNERMPLSRSWVEPEVAGLEGRDRATARLPIVLAKAPYQVSDDRVAELVDGDEARFVRVLAWASFAAARRFAGTVAATVKHPAEAAVVTS
jgi:hypothetical protein